MKIEWKDSLTWKDYDEAIEFLNIVDWNLTIRNKDNKWFLFSGEVPVFSSELMDEVNVFVMGMALSFSVLPEEIIKTIQKVIGKE